MSKQSDYRQLLQHQYQNSIVPLLGLTRSVNAAVVIVSWSLMALLIIVSLIMSHTTFWISCSYFLLGCLVWEFSFITSHVIIHKGFKSNGKTLNQDVFSFYHHYVDREIYRKYRIHYHGYQLIPFIYFMIPLLFVQPWLGLGAITLGYLHLDSHRWYHTRKALRKKAFGRILYYLFLSLEKIKLIDTTKHMRIHHNHDVAHLEQVKGWCELYWPLLTKPLEKWGDFLYHKIKNSANSYQEIYLVISLSCLYLIIYLLIHGWHFPHYGWVLLVGELLMIALYLIKGRMYQKISDKHQLYWTK